MWVTTYMKVITIEVGTTVFIMVRDGGLFTLGTILGITVVGTAHGLTVDGMTHGIMDMVVGMEAGADGTVLGITAVGILLGIMDMEACTTLGTMVDITVTAAVIAMVFTMGITVA